MKENIWEMLDKGVRIRIKGFLCMTIVLVLLASAVAGVVKHRGAVGTKGEGQTEAGDRADGTEGYGQTWAGNHADGTKAEGQTEAGDRAGINGEERGKALSLKNISMIRVLIRTTGYESIYHERLELSADCDCTLVYGIEGARFQELLPAGEAVTLETDSVYFHEGDKLYLKPVIPDGNLHAENISRSCGKPIYHGSFEVIKTAEGLILINETAMETYLCGVVPSEMPASYPEEALKAQAVCARTYAAGKILNSGYPEYDAHLDDSTAFQVFQNVSPEERTTRAVEDTEGMILLNLGGEPANAYYYSTSCGQGTDESVWHDKETKGGMKARKISRRSMESYLAGSGAWEPTTDGGTWTKATEGGIRGLETDGGAWVPVPDTDDYEVDEPWYRWTYEVERLDFEAFRKRLFEYLAGEGHAGDLPDFKKVREITATDRSPGGAVTGLHVVTDQGEYQVIGEYQVRALLCDQKAMARRLDQSEVPCGAILPSAFFSLHTSQEDGNVVGYTIYGGGYGHGVGMSQNAAKMMALDGRSMEEILGFFYGNATLARIR